MSGSFRMPVYQQPDSPVIEPEQDPVKKEEELPVDDVTIEATNIPYRGQGVPVEHGVEPVEEAAFFEDEFTKASRAANKPAILPEPREELTPFPVMVVSMVPPVRERKVMNTGRERCSEQRSLLGPDDKRTRLCITVLASSTGGLYIGDTADVSPVNGFLVPDDGLEHQYFTNGPVYCTVDPGMIADFYLLVERVTNL